MERDSAVLKVFKTVSFGQQPMGRSKKRWVDCLDSNFSIKIKNWSSMAKRRTAWLSLLKKAKAHEGLSSQYDNEDTFCIIMKICT